MIALIKDMMFSLMERTRERLPRQGRRTRGSGKTIHRAQAAVRTGLPNLMRSQSEKLRRLRDRLDPLYRQACQYEAARRAATERRSARKMPTPTVAEADAWHRRLTSTNPAPTKRGSEALNAARQPTTACQCLPGWRRPR
jgi:hypothetical protein